MTVSLNSLKLTCAGLLLLLLQSPAQAQNPPNIDSTYMQLQGVYQIGNTSSEPEYIVIAQSSDEAPSSIEIYMGKTGNFRRMSWKFRDTDPASDYYQLRYLLSDGRFLAFPKPTSTGVNAEIHTGFDKDKNPIGRTSFLYKPYQLLGSSPSDATTVEFLETLGINTESLGPPASSSCGESL